MATAFKIEKGLPIPPSLGTRGPKPIYPFGELEVGDCFFVPEPRKGLRSTAYEYGRRHGKRFASAHENGGLRIWRVA